MVIRNRSGGASSRRYLLASAVISCALVATSCSYLPHDSLSTVGSFTTLESTAAFIAEAKALGVTAVRGSQDVGSPPKDRNVAFLDAGFDLVLHAKSGPALASPPLTTDAQIGDYQRDLASTLDALHPMLLAVENEENWTGFYTGTTEEYLRQLSAAASVAHARQIPVSDGGITSTMAALAAWKDLKDRGLDAQAADFASRAFPDQAWIRADLARSPFQGLSRAPQEASRKMALELIVAFRTAPIDAVNFHWYIDDDQALAQTIDYLRRATGKPILTTEIGQHNTDVAVPSGHLTTTVADEHLPFVIWFDADGDPAQGLHDATTHALRPNGTEFKAWLASHRDLIRPATSD